MSRIAILKEKLYKKETSSLRGKQLPIDKPVEELQAKIQQIDAKRVVLTAGHMTDDPSIAFVRISFDPIASWPPWGAGKDWYVVESWYTHSDYEIGVDPQLKDWISHDVGILTACMHFLK